MFRQAAISFLYFFVLVSASLSAQDVVTLRKVKTGVYLSPPFVMKDSTGYYSGMAIDLWKLLEDEMNYVSEYVEYPTWHQMMEAVASGEVHMVVSNISVTYERAQEIKFSYPWFDSGLRIMVKSSGQGSMWEELKRNGHIQTYIWIVSAIIFITIILTVIHRRRDSDFPRNWLDGFSESLYRLVVAIKTGVVNNKNYNWFGKILAVIWMFAGVGLVAYITSSITSSMTAVALTHDIHSLADLPGKRVGVLANGVAQEYMQHRGISTISYESTDMAAQALMDNEIDAVVDDAPVLEYWTFVNSGQNLKVVGNIFHPDKYAFAANKRYSEQMDSISVALIKLIDLEKVSALKSNYFGNMH